ncbi:MAG: flavin reductase family protein [Hyphomicrobiaceae bacterium]
MHYDAIKRDHGLPIDPFKAIVMPRPIGWISTVSSSGICNLAPYSFFNAVADTPPYVMFASGARKDSQRNAEETGEFVCSIVSYDLREAMNATSATVSPDVDEFELAGLEKAASRFVAPPRVKAAPAALECRYWKSVELPGGSETGTLVIGAVVGIYLDDRFVKDGRVDSIAMRPLARLGYSEYAVAEAAFRMRRPD